MSPVNPLKSAAMSYSVIGKHVRVQLYTRNGEIVKAISGRVADFSPQYPLSETIRKDLILVVDIKTPDGTSYVNSAGGEEEGWFALADCQIIEEETSGFPSLSLN